MRTSQISGASSMLKCCWQYKSPYDDSEEQQSEYFQKREKTSNYLPTGIFFFTAHCVISNVPYCLNMNNGKRMEGIRLGIVVLKKPQQLHGTSDAKSLPLDICDNA